jgi:tRNA 2-thiouridine synthesizing protein A
MSAVPDTRLDCLGLYCPVPILKIREAIGRLAPGQVVEMTSDDPASEADMKSWTRRAGHELLEIEKHDTVFRFVVRKTR